VRIIRISVAEAIPKKPRQPRSHVLVLAMQLSSVPSPVPGCVLADALHH
jgi:hypothetical protein